jgi:uncharacterized protein (TIGR02145 family)
MLSAASMNAQVTIGSLSEPHGAAVLDLSQVPNADKGLLLPRVFLRSAKEWAPLEGTAIEGMMVYNENKRVLYGNRAGIYVWIGPDKGWASLEPVEFCSGVKDIEGNCYFTGDFGAAGTWMTQNLQTKHYADGTDIPSKYNDSSQDAAKAFYWYPSLSTSIAETVADTWLESHYEYGLLYTWAAASNRGVTSANESNMNHESYQGACPDGWHLPSALEWLELEKVIDDNTTGEYSTTTGTGNTGKKMKSAIHVNGVNSGGESKTAANGGFDVLLMGSLDGGSAYNFGRSAAIWSSSSVDGSNAWYANPVYNSPQFVYKNYYKYNLFSVRCKKNN